MCFFGEKSIKFIFVFSFFLLVGELIYAKPRVVISTDFSPLDVCMSGCAADHTSDPDDVQSMVRFLLYTNEFDVEGLVASAGTFANIAKKQNILDIINLYAKVYDNLSKHDSAYPSADYLSSVTFQGRSGTWGKTVSNNIGVGKDSEASNAIINIVDKPDTRPVWFCFWGDCSNLAQAIWKVQNTRSAEELKVFLSKIRIYQIAHQDDTIDWLMSNFPELFIIYSKSTYMGIFGGSGDSLGNLAWLNKNIIQDHGPLGAVYPKAAMSVDGLKEGDSPSFMYLVSATRGLNNPEDPTQQSWGGQYVRSGNTNHWVDGVGESTISKWKSQYQADFALRADWMMDQTSSFHDIKKGNNITIYPNPAKNVLNVKSENEFDALKIFDLEGKLVLENTLNEPGKVMALPLSLKKGVYVVEVANKHSVSYSKMIHF